MRGSIDRDGSWAEAAITAAVGAAIAGGLAHRLRLGKGATRLLAAVGAANGAISGRRGIYDVAEAEGLAALVLDSSWSVTNTAAGLVVHAVQPLTGDPDYRPELSRRRNRHVYGRGFAVRKGFVFAQGNVISNAAGDHDLTADDRVSLRRRLLLDRHEDLHVWQARWFGPLYAPLYVGAMVIGALRGAVRWARRRDHPLWDHVEVGAYYENPFERWAYAADDNWPPRAVSRLHSRSVQR